MIEKFVMIASLLASTAQAKVAERHSVTGILLEVKPAKHLIIVSCDAIPGYMEAMVMPFAVRQSETLKSLQPGTAVRFDMIGQGREDYAEHIQAIQISNFESEPTEAGRLTFLHRALDPAAAARIVAVGQPVPDFALFDQAQHLTRLTQFRGKVIALTFAYSRCPNPNYCFRLSNNLFRLSRRFHSQTGRELILMTIVIDPDQDRGKALERYADTWKANPEAWRFLTGSLSDIRGIAERFGMNFWNDEGFLIHSFHTVVIDREGKMAANLEGNQFTAEQLGDLVETVLHRPIHQASVSTLARVK